MGNEKKPLLFYDVGELGWSLPLTAHMNWLLINDNRKIAVCTFPERFVLYNGIKIERIPIPDKIFDNINDSSLDQDGTHLYSHKKKKCITNDILFKYINKHFRDSYEVVNEYGAFFNKRMPYRFNSSQKAMKTCKNLFSDKPLILVFPRKRKGKFGNRNLTEKFYINLCNRLCNDYPMHTVSAMGSVVGSHHIDSNIKYDNFVDLTTWSDLQSLDLMIAACVYQKVDFAVGSQSSLPKISLMCGVPTFIMGHEKKRHMIDDNWMNTRVGFHVVKRVNGKYRLNNHKKCIDEIIRFGNIDKPIIFDEKVVREDRASHPISRFYNDDPLLFCDVGEVGWTQYLVAFVKKFREKHPWRRLIVITSKAKFVFYRDCCDDLLELPDKIKEMTKNMSAEQHFMIDPHNINNRFVGKKMSSILSKIYPQCDIFNSFDKVKYVSNKFYTPYISSKKARDYVRKLCGKDNSILIFPRRREGIHGDRNLSYRFYVDLCHELRNKFPNHLLISIGSKSGAYELKDEIVHRDLVYFNDNETLDILVAFCNLNKAMFTFGPQSGLSKISLLCGIPSFIVGHEKKRHMIEENWAKTFAGFFEGLKSDIGYIINKEKCVEEVLKFAEQVKEGRIWM